MKSSKQGFGILQGLLAIAVLGISSYAVLQVMNRSNKVSQQTTRSISIEFLLDQTTQAGRKVVSDIGAGSEGVCRIMRADGVNVCDPSLPSGLAKINLELFSSANTSLDAFAPDWRKAFPSTLWQATQCRGLAVAEGNNVGTYARCFVPVPSAWPQLGSAELVKSQQIQIMVFLSPVVLSARSSGLSLSSDNQLQKIVPPTTNTLQKINARDHGFLVTARVSWKPDTQAKQRSLRAAYSMVWAGEYSCVAPRIHPDTKQVCPASAKRVTLNPSAIGSGAMPTNGIVLFSSTKDDNREELTATFDDVTFTKASISDRNRAITGAGKGISFSAACQELQYRCKKRSEPRTWSDAMDLRLSLGYLGRYNKVVEPKLSFIDKGTTQAVLSRLSSGSDLNSFKTTLAHPTIVPASPTKITLIPNMPSSLNLLSVTASNVDAQACPTMCSNNGSGSNWRAEMTFSPITGTYVDANPVGCVCCNMKQCLAWGNKTTSCETQAPEPLDARIPECDALDSTLIGTALALPQGSLPAAALTAGHCVSARIVENAGGAPRLEYLAESCTTPRAATCFASGRFFVTGDANPTENKMGPFSQAPDLCYNLGEQKVNKAELDRLLTAQGNRPGTMPPQSGALYSYIDGALIGQFIAPQTAEHESMVIAAIKRAWPTPEARANARVWLNLKVSEGGHVVMPALLAPLGAHSSANGWVSFYDNVGPKLHVVKDAPHAFNVASPNSMLLAHSRRYVGGIAVAGTQNRDLSVLCLRPSTRSFFASSAKTNTRNDASKICVDEGGLFIAPSTSAQWSAALLAVAKPHPYLPWPDPNPSGFVNGDSQTSAQVNAAWVALDHLGQPVHNFNTASSDNEVRLNQLLGIADPTGGVPNPNKAFALCLQSSTGVTGNESWPVLKKFQNANPGFSEVSSICGADGYYFPSKSLDTIGLSRAFVEASQDLGSNINSFSTQVILKSSYLYTPPPPDPTSNQDAPNEQGN